VPSPRGATGGFPLGPPGISGPNRGDLGPVAFGSSAGHPRDVPRQRDDLSVGHAEDLAAVRGKKPRDRRVNVPVRVGTPDDYGRPAGGALQRGVRRSQPHLGWVESDLRRAAPAADTRAATVGVASLHSWNHREAFPAAERSCRSVVRRLRASPAYDVGAPGPLAVAPAARRRHRSLARASQACSRPALAPTYPVQETTPAYRCSGR
jgi:hypothetical protein